MQYVSSQTSSLLLAILTIDRFVVIFNKPGSFLSRLPFSTLRTAHLWSILTIIFTISLNFHIIVYAGVYSSFNSTTFIKTKVFKTPGFECYRYKSGFDFEDYAIVNFVIYSALPSLIMIFFNSIIFYRVFKKQNLKTENVIAQQTFLKRKKTTVYLLVITTTFVIMTLPSMAFYAFIKNRIPILYRMYIDYCVNMLEFSNHSSVFFISYFTNGNFRKIVKKWFFNRKKVLSENKILNHHSIKSIKLKL